MSRQEILSLRLADLRRQKTSTQAQFLALRDDCIKFKSDKKLYTSGNEKIIADGCTQVDGIVKTLESKEIYSRVDKGRVGWSFATCLP